jgi:hypothetical protein
MKILEPVDPNERFRRRRHAARRRRAIRRLTLLGLVAVAAGASTLAARWGGGGDRATTPAAAADLTKAAKHAARPASPAVPAEIRGVHVTMALASVPGRLDHYASFAHEGLNTVELDVKDENGHVGFVNPQVPLARAIGAAQTYYHARAAVRKLHRLGLYVIGRVVVFEDPILTSARPDMAIRTSSGGVWTNAAGLGWANPYDRAVWKYDVDVAAAAAKAGFDEIMFDYVRFPTDGNVAGAVFAGRTSAAKADTIASFLSYARSKLKPLGARISAAVFGLSATRNLGIGQKPRELGRLVDALYPMVYPSHYNGGEFNLPDPSAAPGPTVAFSLRDFNRQLRNRHAVVVPWLQDFSLGRTYTLADVQAQIDAARRQHVHGFLLWNPEGLYSARALAAQ